jgi:hypothetical protein
MLSQKNDDRESVFETIAPNILYFGNPIAIVTSVNKDGTPNLAPISSFWALGWTMVLGLLSGTQTLDNFQERPDCVVNLPSPDMWSSVERLAPLTGNILFLRRKLRSSASNLINSVRQGLHLYAASGSSRLVYGSARFSWRQPLAVFTCLTARVDWQNWAVGLRSRCALSRRTFAKIWLFRGSMWTPRSGSR